MILRGELHSMSKKMKEKRNSFGGKTGCGLLAMLPRISRLSVEVSSKDEVSTQALTVVSY